MRKKSDLKAIAGVGIAAAWAWPSGYAVHLRADSDLSLPLTFGGALLMMVGLGVYDTYAHGIKEPRT